jgi:hypothetical protein
VAAHHWIIFGSNGKQALRLTGRRESLQQSAAKLKKLSHLFGYFFGKKAGLGFARLVFAFASFGRFQTFRGFAATFGSTGGQREGSAHEEKQKGEQTEVSHRYGDKMVEHIAGVVVWRPTSYFSRLP